jgi:uncharacterized protein (TIGR04222 family)
MNWLLHNAVADLYGPYFLLFYAAAIVALIVACYRSVRSLDRTNDLEPPEIPAKLDPYEIAYLRGGKNEVTRVAIASLIQRGLLQITEKKGRVSTTKEIDKGRKPASGELLPIEACVLKWPRFPVQPATIFQPGGLSSSVKEACEAYRAKLDEEGFLTPQEMKAFGVRLWLIGSALILGLGGYKLAVALAKGHTNVAFLCILGIGGVIALAVTCLALPRLSRLGKAYLEQLKLAYDGLKSQVHPVGSLESPLTWANDPGNRGRLQHASAYSDCLLMVGIFGVASLADTPLSDVTTMFKQGASASGGCGGGCGGGGGGCGGGGCGGGCGGGGCGGCGG